MASIDPSQVRYGIFILHLSEPHVVNLVRKFRALRLQSLKESPEAWLSTYEKEVDLPLSEWHEYLLNPRRTVFVCVAEPTNSSESPTLEHSDWIGMIHLLGPYELSKWTWPRATPLHDDSVELRYHVTGAFVAAKHRRNDPPILARLIWFYNDWQVAHARKLLADHHGAGRAITAVYCRQRSVLTPQTRHLRSFYERLGTIHAGFITAAEEFKANEDKVPLPKWSEETRAFYEEKNMMAFEKILRVTDDAVWPEGVLASEAPWLGSLEERYIGHSSSADARKGDDFRAAVLEQLKTVSASKL